MLFPQEKTREIPRFTIPMSMFKELEKVKKDLKTTYADLCRYSLFRYLEEYKATQNNKEEEEMK